MGSPDSETSVPLDDKEFGTLDNTSTPDRDDQIHSDSSPDPGPHDWAQYTLRKRPWQRRVTPFSQIVEAKFRGNGTREDPFIVQWLNDDAENPKGFSTTFKWLMTFLLAFTTLCVSLASSAYTGAAGLIIREFHCSREVFLLGLSLMVAGFAIGPLVWAPLSEAVARREIVLLALLLYIVFTAVCAAAQDIATMIVLRFFCGTFGSAVFVIPGGQLSDIFEAEQRGSEYF
jgi:hypothetical protein